MPELRASYGPFFDALVAHTMSPTPRRNRDIVPRGEGDPTGLEPGWDQIIQGAIQAVKDNPVAAIGFPVAGGAALGATALASRTAARQGARRMGQEGVMAGPLAKTAPLDRLKAFEAEARGESYDPLDPEMWQKHGWVRPPNENVPRWEIPDNLSRLNEQNVSNYIGMDQRAPLPAILEHAPLLEAYPKLGGFNVKFKDMPVGMYGQYDELGKTFIVNKNLTPKEMHRTLLHEIQHAVQGFEGMARGGPSFGAKRLVREQADNDLMMLQKQREGVETARRNMRKNQGPASQVRTMEKMIQQIDEEIEATMGQLKKLNEMDDYDVYYDLLGEIESREVEKRAFRSPVTNREYPPDYQPTYGTTFIRR